MPDREPKDEDRRTEAAPRITDRRAFLRHVGGLGIGIAGVGALGALTFQAEADEATPEATVPPRVFDTRVPAQAGAPLLVTVSGGERAAAVRRAVEELGGIGRFVKSGESVLIKPNVGWDRLPIHGANTDPEVVGAVVALCKEAGASKIVVTDVSCNDPRRCFERSGIWRAAEDAGAEVILPADGMFEEVELGGVLGRWSVLKPLLEATRIINVPVAKHHGTARLTAGMKNWYGVLSDSRRSNLHRKMDQGVADLAAAIRPTLTIVDANRVMVRNGPQGGGLSDVEERKLLGASTDPVAVDAWAATLLGKTTADIGYIGLAAQAGLGSVQLADGEKRELTL
jgi:uncharacterized protein (DUF362 family)